jgi:succinate dehydrogenase/fumarate reductase flavoprotein subunit
MAEGTLIGSDILVIGAGPGGLLAALSAKRLSHVMGFAALTLWSLWRSGNWRKPAAT